MGLTPKECKHGVPIMVGCVRCQHEIKMADCEEEKMEGKDKVSQAHLDALPVLLEPLVEAKGKGLSSAEIYKILYEWDRARKI